ncbi:MAG: hypothetical protein ACE14W_03225 [Candidatus Velamenicoccus archaeovorus]
MSTRRTRAGWALALPGTLALALGLLVAPPVVAAPNKPYSASVAPACVSPGTLTFTVAITNESRSQSLGSADVLPPADSWVLVSVVSSTLPDVTLGTDPVTGRNAVLFRNLNLAFHGSVQAQVSVSVPASATTGSWTVIAKQANDFSGPPGNDLGPNLTPERLTSFVGECRLVFTTQPADAKAGDKITGDAATPDSTNHVTVTAEDPVGNTVTSFGGTIGLSIDPDHDPGGPGVTLQGTTDVQAVNGVAAFTNISIGTTGEGYQLLATAPGFTDASSAPFSIGDAACPPNADCTFTETTEGTIGSTTGNVINGISSNGGPNGGVIISSSSNVAGDQIDCDGYTEHTNVTTTFTVTTGQMKTVTVTIDKKLVQADPDNGAAHYLVCYQNDTGFYDVNGDWVPAGESGVLPDCLGDLSNLPCRFSANKTKSGVMVIVYKVPAGDPKGRV